MSFKWLIAWLSTLVAALAAFLISKTSKTIGIILIMLTALYCVQYFKDDYLKLKHEEAVLQEAKEIRDLQYKREQLELQRKAQQEQAKKEKFIKKVVVKKTLEQILKENEDKRLGVATKPKFIDPDTIPNKVEAANCDVSYNFASYLSKVYWQNRADGFRGRLKMSFSVLLSKGMPLVVVIDEYQSFPEITNFQQGVVLDNFRQYVASIPCTGTGIRIISINHVFY
jgi:hypothetical protein